ncbi:PDR/VanB family oxidoreductase [Alsobacter sp. R-9]
MATLPQWRGATLRSITDLTPDIRLFEIEPEGGLGDAAPGSHVTVAVQIDGRPDTRSYSVVGAGDGAWRIAVKLLPTSRGGSRSMWNLAPGARLRVAGPGNHFALRLGRPEYLLLAGGIGVTPIVSMAHALVRRGENVRMIYAARTRQDLAFGDDLTDLLGDRLATVIDAEGDRLDVAAAIASLHPEGEMYMCGPIGLMEAVKRAWQDSRRPLDHLRFETFGNSGRHATAPFTVRIPRLGLEIPVPENRTMLDALEEAGVAMIHDCRRGECGLCALRILGTDGLIDHRDVFFSDEEKAANEKLCTCVSRMAAGGVITVDTADRPA